MKSYQKCHAIQSIQHTQCRPRFMTTNITYPPATQPPLVIRAIRKFWRLAVDQPYRDMTWLHVIRPSGAFQPFNDNEPNRYPGIFSFVQSTLGAASDIRVLSFGCSTGEEVFSLRQYFPRAVIKGLDINSGNIAACRRRLRQAPDRHFVRDRKSDRRGAVGGLSSAWGCFGMAVSVGRVSRGAIRSCVSKFLRAPSPI